MAFKLMDLPYDSEAIAPAITAETFSYHHGKHHQAYVDKTNDAIEGTDHAHKSLEDIIAASRGSDKGLFNNSAQVWNHGFYWHSLTPENTGPSGELAALIEDSFGSLDELKDQLKSKGAGHFASGWVWLVEKGGKLAVEDSHDADTMVDQGVNPLLVIDLWEHAYYLDHQNARPKYLEAVVDGHLNWGFAADNLARGSAWTYPQ
ncbi:superoxide dismutase [Aurantiacibacter gangjinensis]|uniref:Superoxide dismutase n=1 Tax=Aurantiacibacter gangjinensis TaxID=502682 RepID=A0A0G9MK52_9SPHN|nr:superoxide dismutase [Aurantiacibacter gangjinensis]APE29340.1 Superoxide dismutase [Aurantiacibacter gangjinensis]KLE31077.1 superoxide dismutase [Aurantiacibacter gangjinensis]